MSAILYFLFGIVLLQQTNAVPNLANQGFGKSIYPTASRLVGGSQAARDEFPFVASLQMVSLWAYHFCGSTILNPRTFLTAAHCIQPLLINNEEIFSNIWALYSLSDNDWLWDDMEGVHITDYLIHPHWNSTSVKNDVGLLFSSKDILSSHNAFIHLNTAAIGGGTPLVVAGWGATSINGDVVTRLRKMETTSLTHEQCVLNRDKSEQQWSSILGEIPLVDAEAEICTQRAQVSICYGDSGSPLLIPGTNQQVGLSSWAIPCGLEGPNVFTRINTYLGWINNNALNV